MKEMCELRFLVNFLFSLASLWVTALIKGDVATEIHNFVKETNVFYWFKFRFFI